ncbi:nucleotide disphospho-sugar-binding domain-containing protein [Edaphobacter aggregans]|uniref:nucleotide disphospho-sugar-binding domain-containing protein n=1 Tax=Edaphobacter aggregans TaxID=570835 RepID=UPI00068C7BF7|nr:nucleotide disphospho-sugar-binding domain-containing protein [Edaphobacter aggregans]
MARLGAFCFPGTGHINPLMALAKELERRSHKVIVFGIADTEERIRAAGIEFRLVGADDYPLGTLRLLDQRLGQLSGLATFRFTVERVRNTASMLLRDGPAAVRAANLDAMLIDEADMAGSIAEHLGLPFISLAFFPPLIHDDRIPPFCFPWQAGAGPLTRLRNRLGMRLLYRIASPIYAVVNRQRRRWGLPALRGVTDALSPLAQVTQLPAALEFNIGIDISPLLHYTGPFLDSAQRPPIDFPWQQLDGRPLVYASLGTMQNNSTAIFRTIAQACAPLDAQLVLSLGGGLDPAQLGPLPGNPIVVPYVPQLQILQRAATVITHAGLNTVLESLTEGLPLVAVPQGNDQPGVAARIAACGSGIIVPSRRLTTSRLRSALQSVLQQPEYRAAARRIQRAMQTINGKARAADIIEDVLRIRIESAGNTAAGPTNLRAAS